jgi:ribosome-associated protein
MTIIIKASDIHYQFSRSGGPGGQHVNKTESAVQLRFNVYDAHLPEAVRTRLLSLLGKRLTQSGDLIIRAARFRKQERNKQDAYERLMAWIAKASVAPVKRKKTKPGLASKQRRLSEKKLRGKTKVLRRKSHDAD